MRALGVCTDRLRGLDIRIILIHIICYFFNYWSFVLLCILFLCVLLNYQCIRNNTFCIAFRIIVMLGKEFKFAFLKFQFTDMIKGITTAQVLGDRVNVWLKANGQEKLPAYLKDIYDRKLREIVSIVLFFEILPKR